MTSELVSVKGDADEPLDDRIDAGIPSWLLATERGVVGYRVFGDPSAAPVILTHAVPLSSLAWVSVLPHLAARGLRVYAIDMPGSGDTPPAPAPLNIEGYAESIRAFADAAGLATFHLIGHASHAASALNFAARHPDRVEKLVLSKLPYVDEAGRARMGAATASWYSPDGPPALPPLDQWQPRPNVTSQRFAVLRQRLAFDMYRAGSRSAEGHQALSTYDLLADLRSLRTATRFVWGEGDHFGSHRDIVVSAAAQVNPEVRIVAGASAFPMYERPRGWALATGSFLI